MKEGIITILVAGCLVGFLLYVALVDPSCLVN